MKSEFFHIYKQTHYGIAIPVVKDEMEIELPVTINEQIFTEISDPIADQHPAKKFGDLIYYDKSEPPPPPQQSTSTIIKEKEKKVEPEKNYEERIDGDKKRFSCKICKINCSNICSIKNHIKRHLVTERNFVCEHCGSTYRFKDDLAGHIVRYHYDKSNVRCVW